ncbi:MAG: hypothetical protein IKO49_05080 [Bacilli bacterium]|nr:hypothetical protein [Bacilli bacterium]
MNYLIVKDEAVIENLIYVIREVQVILDSEISSTQCHDYLYNKIVKHYNIGKPISVFIKLNFLDADDKLTKTQIGQS